MIMPTLAYRCSRECISGDAVVMGPLGIQSMNSYRMFDYAVYVGRVMKGYNGEE